MAVLGAVTESLDAAGIVGWQRELALSLASSMDASPNASTAKELRGLMDELGAVVADAKGDVSDDLAARRASRRAASSS